MNDTFNITRRVLANKCINCKWCFETSLSRVCDNGCSEFYSWDIEPYTVACEHYKENGGE